MSADAIHDPAVLSSSEARAHWTNVLGRAQFAGEVTLVSRRGHESPVVAVVPAERWKLAERALEILEDAKLGQLAQEAIEADRGHERVSADDLYRELGL